MDPSFLSNRTDVHSLSLKLILSPILPILCKMKRVQARDLAGGGSKISRNYAAWRASADFGVLLRDSRDLRVKGRAQSYSRRKRGTSRNYANSYLGI